MKRYIALLRAVNVGGTTIIKMSDLKRMFESFGLQNVETYIQSGNVIFDSDESRASVLEAQIERQLEEAYGKRIQLFVRTIKEVVAMAEECPFDPGEGETAYVAILDKMPGRKSMEALRSLRSDADDFAFKGRDVFALRRDRDKSIFSNNQVEKTLGIPATTRNLTTIKKLAEKYTE
jgi:uncharacterized protein (DUF1697 family)